MEESTATATAAPPFSYAALQAELSHQGSCPSTDAGLHLQDFFAHLCAHGFARLRLGADEVRCLVEMYGQAREFFGLPQYFKDTVCPYRPSLEIGYSHVRHLAKEFFAVRLTADGQSIETNGAELVPDEYQTLAVDSFKLMDRIAKDCLKYIAAGLKVDPGKLTSLAEDFPLGDRSGHSVSFLHVFKYSNTEAGHVAMSCPPHTDSGLVTIIPCAQAPGLEILDWETSQWRSVEEEGASYPTDFVVLVGETLARLTCAHLQASVHRVRSRPDLVDGEAQSAWTRYSLPFQLRGRLDAVIDSVALASPLVPDPPEHLRHNVTVRDFIQ